MKTQNLVSLILSSVAVVLLVCILVLHARQASSTVTSKVIVRTVRVPVETVVIREGVVTGYEEISFAGEGKDELRITNYELKELNPPTAQNYMQGSAPHPGEQGMVPRQARDDCRLKSAATTTGETPVATTRQGFQKPQVAFYKAVIDTNGVKIDLAVWYNELSRRFKIKLGVKSSIDTVFVTNTITKVRKDVPFLGVIAGVTPHCSSDNGKVKLEYLEFDAGLRFLNRYDISLAVGSNKMFGLRLGARF
jgi:hypothetical protein